MSTSGKDEPRHQTFNGPGSVGRDNIGTINNNVLLNPRTAAAMEDLNRKAPELATLLKKALRDGFISPDAVIALNRAVDHLNEDTAQAFRFAAERINEETAICLRSVANDLTVADQKLGERVTQINHASEELREMIKEIGVIQGANASGHQLQPPNDARIPSRRSIRSAADNWVLILQLMCFCLGGGLLTTAILAHYHMGRDALIIGAYVAAIPLIMWIVKVWQVLTKKDRPLSPPPRPPR